jgi:hypothetical protein
MSKSTGPVGKRIALSVERLEDRAVPSANWPDLGAGLESGEDLLLDPVFSGSDLGHGKKGAPNGPNPGQMGAVTGGGQVSAPIVGQGGQTPDGSGQLIAQFAAALNAIKQGNAGTASSLTFSPSLVTPSAVHKPLAPTLLNKFQGLTSTDGGGYYPPDSQAAAGPTVVINTVNQALGIFNKSTGATIAKTSFGTFWGSLPKVGGFSDPTVVYDDTLNAFIVGDQNVNPTNGTSVQDFAISKSSTPGGLTSTDWNFYHFTTTEPNGGGAGVSAWADYPGKIGFNDNAIVFTFNMFGKAPTFPYYHVQVNMINKSTLPSGGGAVTPHQFDDTTPGVFTLSPVSMHASVSGDAMYFLTTDPNYGTGIDVVKLPYANLFSGNASNFTVTPISGTSFTGVYGTGERLNADVDSRMQSAAMSNGEMVGAQTVVHGGHVEVQWYEINVSGTPALTQEGDVASVKSGGDTYYPGIDINAGGAIGLTFIESVGAKASAVPPNEYPSMYVTGWAPGDTSGTTEAPILVFAGTADNVTTRGGDMATMAIDPTDGTFWGCNEFITGSSPFWNQGIAHFELGSPPTLTSLSQSSAAEGSAALTITVNGTNFISGTTALWNGTALTTTVVSSTQLTVVIPAADLAEQGTFTITAQNSAGTSATGQTFTVTDAGFTSVTAAPGVQTAINTPLNSSLVATFVDPGTDGTTADYTATVMFTDPSGVVHTVTGVVKSLGGDKFGVYAASGFAYTKTGAFAFSVTIKDNGGTTATVGGLVLVAPTTGLFFTDGINQLWLFINGKFTNTGAFASKFSGGIDSAGLPECFFFDGNNQLWRDDNGKFTNLGAFGTKLVAGAGAVAFTDGNNGLWIYHDSTGKFTNTGAFAMQMSGGFDLTGAAFVAFTDASNQIWELTGTGKLVNTGAFGTRISAGTDASGNFEIWYTDGNNQIWRFDNGKNSTIGAFGVTIQAGFGGVLYFTDGINQIWTLTDAGVGTNTGAFALRTSSGAGAQALFFDDGNNQIWEFENGLFTDILAYSVKLSAF